MNTLCLDIVVVICNYLSDNDIVHFITSVKHLHKMKYHIQLNNLYFPTAKLFNLLRESKCKLFEKQNNSRLAYFKNFINVKIYTAGDLNRIQNLPIRVKKILFVHNFDSSIKNKIPNTVEHLCFRNFYNQNIDKQIPNSVKYLSLNDNFNQNIKDCIPTSVQDLIFGYCFDQDVTGCIPKSVQNLTFGYEFNQDITNAIPKSVQCINFGEKFNQIDSIPRSVNNIIFRHEYKEDEKMQIIKKFPRTNIIFKKY